MELNNFERQIKEKLEQREIRPAEQAWEKISSRLEAREAPEKKTLFQVWSCCGLAGFACNISLVVSLRRECRHN